MSSKTRWPGEMGTCCSDVQTEHEGRTETAATRSAAGFEGHTASPQCQRSGYGNGFFNSEGGPAHASSIGMSETHHTEENKARHHGQFAEESGVAVLEAPPVVEKDEWAVEETPLAKMTPADVQSGIAEMERALQSDDPVTY